MGHDARMEWTGGPRIRGIQGERAMNPASGYRLRATGTGVVTGPRFASIGDGTCHRGTEAQRTKSLCVSVSLWLVIGAGAAANTFAQETSVEQLVATALERSPEIRAARSAITAAGGQVTQAALRPNPTFTASQMLMTGSQHQSLFEVEWPLDLSRRNARVVSAQRSVEAATLGVQDRERMLAASVRDQAGRLLAARRNVEIMNEALTAARRMRELLDAKVTEGYTPKLDANIAAVEAGRLEAAMFASSFGEI